MRYHDDQSITAETIEANRRHDAEDHSVSMDPKVRLHSRSLNTAVIGLLTDRKISRYKAQGWYSHAFKEARREYWGRKQAKRVERRDGNFLVFNDGRKVFSPLG